MLPGLSIIVFRNNGMDFMGEKYLNKHPKNLPKKVPRDSNSLDF